MSFFPPVVFEVSVIAGEAITKFKELNGELDHLQKKADDAGGSLSTLNKGALIAKGGIALLGTSLLAFGKVALEAFAEDSAALASLQVALTNTGNASATTMQQFTDLSNAATALGFTDTEAAKALSTFVTATGSTTDSQKLLSLAMDISRKKHLDLATTAVLLARGTQGSQKSFQDLGVTLDTHLPKQQAINKAYDELTKRTKGENAAWLKTFPGALSIIHAEFDKIAGTVGAKLVPILNALGRIMLNVYNFIKQNADALKALGIVVVIGYGIWKTYQITLIAVNAVQKIQIALNLAAKEGITGMKAAQLLLNDAMKKNPIGIAIAALTILAALFVKAWNHSETFRKVVKFVADAIITFIANMVRAFGGLLEIIFNIVTGPIQLFLKALSYLPGVGDLAKKGLHIIRLGIEAVGNTADAVANKIEGFKKTIDKLGGPKIVKDTTKTVIDDSPFNLDNYLNTDNTPKIKTPKTPKTPKTKKVIDDTLAKLKIESDKILEDIHAHNRQLTIYYKEGNQIVADAITARGLLLTDQLKRDKAAQDTFDEAQFQADRTLGDSKYKLDRDNGDKLAKLYRTLQESNKTAKDAYDDAMSQSAKKHGEELIKLQLKYDADITKAMEDADVKRQSIIKKSIALLTNAFASNTGFNVGSVFANLLPKDNKQITNAIFTQVKDGITISTAWWGSTQQTGVGGLLEKLKTQLTGARDLADDAAKLAALGYSQTFIQEVVAQGPDVGGQLATAILGATPETQAQLKDLYGQVQDVSANGLTALATQMSTSTSLATQALTDEYAQIAIDLQHYLSDANKTFESAKSEQLAKYAEEQIAILKTLTDNNAKAQETLDNALADEALSYKNSLEDMNIQHKNAMRDANKTLQDAIIASQTQFKNDVDKLSADTHKTLDNLMVKIQETSNAMLLLQTGGMGGVAQYLVNTKTKINSITNPDGSVTTYYSDGTQTSTAAPPIVTTPKPPTTNSTTGTTPNYLPGANITQYITSNGTDTSAITDATLAAMKHGSPLSIQGVR